MGHVEKFELQLTGHQEPLKVFKGGTAWKRLVFYNVGDGLGEAEKGIK